MKYTTAAFYSTQKNCTNKHECTKDQELMDTATYAP